MRLRKKSSYTAAIYLRLSREDGDKAESDSIHNQRELINDFLAKHPEIKKVQEYVDDGYSGTNFDRPNFKRMMAEIEKGRMSIGLYYRLSLADGDIGVDDKEESNSIENQRLLLTSFVASRNDLIGEIKEYIDDGFSGTNFDRPAFKRMIEDAKKLRLEYVL